MIKALLVILATILLIGYLWFAHGRNKISVMSDTELKSYIETNLKVGDSSDKIEIFFKTQGWPAAFNKYSSRYEARYDGGAFSSWYVESGVGPHIYVDQDGRLTRIEIVRSATGM